MGIQVSNQTMAYIRNKCIQKQSALRILSAGSNRGKNSNSVNTGNMASKLCVSGQVQSVSGMNVYNAKGRYSYESGFTGIFHYDVYMYEVEGKRYIGGADGYTGGMVIRDSMLDYFYGNMGNPWKMADDYNFSGGFKSFCYSGDDRTGGALTFRYQGSTQVLPASALPKLDANQYPALKAEDNVLMLQSSSYYRFEAGNTALVWAVTENGHVGECNTNFWLYGEDKSNELSNNAQTLLNKLKKGNLYGITELGENGGISYREVKQVFAAIGIKEGKFSIGVDGDAKDYYFCSSGRIIDASSLEQAAESNNHCDFLAKGYQEGDMVKVTDTLQLPIDQNGHIQTSAEEMCRYM